MGKDLEIGIGVTMVDINGLVNDLAKIDKRLYVQNFSAGAQLLARYFSPFHSDYCENLNLFLVSI